MDALSEIKKSIKQIAGQSSGYFYTAKVESVDGETCSVTIDTITLNDVRLRAVINGENSKMLVTPAAGSYVLVADLSGGNMTSLAVISFSEIDKITIDCNDKIVINGGDNAGLVKIRELENNLNKIKNYLSTLNTAISTGLSGTVGNAGAAAATTFSTTMSAVVLNWENMENTKIQH